MAACTWEARPLARAQLTWVVVAGAFAGAGAVAAGETAVALCDITAVTAAARSVIGAIAADNALSAAALLIEGAVTVVVASRALPLEARALPNVATGVVAHGAACSGYEKTTRLRTFHATSGSLPQAC